MIWRTVKVDGFYDMKGRRLIEPNSRESGVAIEWLVNYFGGCPCRAQDFIKFAVDSELGEKFLVSRKIFRI